MIEVRTRIPAETSLRLIVLKALARAIQRSAQMSNAIFQASRGQLAKFDAISVLWF
jgi:hypothetical protein